jgi:colanic acid/amylovoran biosynthesis glycosyltransferase
MNILYFLNSFPQVSETFIFNEIRELTRRNVNISVFSLHTPEVLPKHEGVADYVSNTIYFDNLSKVQKIKLIMHHGWHGILMLFTLIKINNTYKMDFTLSSIFKNALPISGLIHKHSISHIHCHFADKNTKYAFLISKALNTTYSFTTHGYDIYFRPPDQYPALIQNSSFCLTVSQANRNYLIDRYGNVAEKFRVLPMGINLDFFQTDTSVQREGNKIVTVARLVPVKALEYAIEAAAILKDQGYPFFWSIVGEGSERNSLQDLINTSNLQNIVILTGQKSDKEIRKLLNESSIFVLSSISEGLGVCLMEALAMECAVVATNVGGIGELIINNETGFLVEPRTPRAIASAIETYLNDKKIMQQLSKNGRRHIVENFNINSQCEKLLSLFSNTK